MHPFRDTPVVVGHRGAPLVAQENTPASYVAAATAGATWVELDVRRSADGLVVHHDPRTADGVPLLARSSAELAPRGVHGLAEVLECMPAGLGVDVELKNLPLEPDYDHRLAVLMAAAPLLREAAATRPLCVTSFDPRLVAAARRMLEGLVVGLVHSRLLSASQGIRLARRLGARLVCPHYTVRGLGQAAVSAAHGAGLAVLVWTVDDADRARRLAAHGVDAVCTNDPTRIAPVIDAARSRQP